MIPILEKIVWVEIRHQLGGLQVLRLIEVIKVLGLNVSTQSSRNVCQGWRAERRGCEDGWRDINWGWVAISGTKCNTRMLHNETLVSRKLHTCWTMKRLDRWIILHVDVTPERPFPEGLSVKSPTSPFMLHNETEESKCSLMGSLTFIALCGAMFDNSEPS